MKKLRHKATGKEKEYSDAQYKAIMGNPITAVAFEDLGEVKKVDKAELALLEQTKPRGGKKEQETTTKENEMSEKQEETK